ncbi:unnamed protein product [Lactuca virosa]|uniref:Uncharacterized protein n=1 Tax=Lactuca virosa TaxID=75947 RepID=A0AAU9LP45_9ASTR|nr:unnamed protein product [Lactuca virosa]
MYSAATENKSESVDFPVASRESVDFPVASRDFRQVSLSFSSLLLCPTVMAVDQANSGGFKRFPSIFRWVQENPSTFRWLQEISVDLRRFPAREATIPSTSGDPGDVSDSFRRCFTLQATISGEVSHFRWFPAMIVMRISLSQSISVSFLYSQ